LSSSSSPADSVEHLGSIKVSRRVDWAIPCFLKCILALVHLLAGLRRRRWVRRSNSGDLQVVALILSCSASSTSSNAIG
jgi:hypothetical protein